MSLPINAECLQCHLRRNVARARALGDEATATAFTQALMRMLSEAPRQLSSPCLVPGEAALFQQFYGLGEDQYVEEKALANRFVMERYATIETMAAEAPDPVFAALQLAVLGNYLDFGALQGQVSMEKMEEMLLQARDMDLDRQTYELLCADLQSGRELLYLTDNAGEIGFDRILAEQIQKKYPHLHITFCVRGGPTLNDATREDAAFVQLPFAVIDNGNTVSGTELTMLSQEAAAALQTADVILSKGMANTETLYGCGYNIYYAFLVKCPRLSQEFQQPLMTPMLVRERNG